MLVYMNNPFVKTSVGDTQNFAIADPCPYDVKYS